MSTTLSNTASTPTMTTRTYKFADLRKRQALFIDGLINAGYSGNSTTRRAGYRCQPGLPRLVPVAVVAHG
jgi:hypothetical protein